ncbi:MAG TPA: hypothetical protein VFB89_12530, partial [Gemmatimonadales bacterium]|nr:hypothetical protein [Gemmatimonadales bacterium]
MSLQHDPPPGLSNRGRQCFGAHRQDNTALACKDLNELQLMVIDALAKRPSARHDHWNSSRMQEVEERSST